MSPLCLLLLLLFADPGTGQPSPSPSPAASPPTPPTVTVSLERSVIREEDNVPVNIWLTNPGSQALNEVQVSITSPGFLTLSTSQCAGTLVKSAVKFGSVPANSSTSCTLNLVTTKDKEIVVGDYNLLFTFQYQWQDNNGVHGSVVTTEKPVKVNLLGTDSVAGIPLALAGFIIPGLFFWIAIRLFKVPWGVDLPLGDKTIYSIIISSLFMAVGAWYDYFNVNNGISLNKLLKLAGAGFAAGVVLAIAYHVWARRQRKKREANRISFNDSEAVIFGKALELNSNYNPGKLRRLLALIFPRAAYRKPVTLVRLSDKTEYVGSFAVTDEESVVLLGWFSINPAGANQATLTEAKRLEEQGKILELYRFASQNKLPIEVSDQIRQRSDDAAQGGALLVSKAQVVLARPEFNKRAREPLSVG